jgi:hypothetical protein
MSAPAPVANASANAKKTKGVSCQPLNNKGTPKGNAVSFTVTPRSANSAAAPMAAPPMAAANAQAVQKAKVNEIVAQIVTSANNATAANIGAFNTLLTQYNAERAKITPTAEKDVVPIDTGLTDMGAIKTAMDEAVKAVQSSAPKAGGGRRKTHRKKHGKRHSKRHCKTHKKHGGKRSTKHHKKHGKTRGKRSKTHKKRHHKKH